MVLLPQGPPHLAIQADTILKTLLPPQQLKSKKSVLVLLPQGQPHLIIRVYISLMKLLPPLPHNSLESVLVLLAQGQPPVTMNMVLKLMHAFLLMVTASIPQSILKVSSTARLHMLKSHPSSTS